MKYFYFISSVLISLMFFSKGNTGAFPSVSSLSLDERIGQLCIAPLIIPFENNSALITSSGYTVTPQEALNLVEKYHIGGIVFLGNSEPAIQKALTQELHALSKTPLFIAQDLEWGLAMRHTNVIQFPRALTLAALPPHKRKMIYALGSEIGNQCQALGVNFNLAPVVDVNVNPKNPIIGMRSFGDSPSHVSELSTLFMKGLLDTGILCCAKHFPGHGDTATDSHLSLPVIPHDRNRLTTVELAPFQALIKQGITAIMSAHLHVPALDPDPSSIATLSYPIITQLLRDELKFNGLILTDGLGMKALTNTQTPAHVAVQAIKAGCDILLCPLDIPASCAAIKEAILSGVISEKELDRHLERILAAKQWLLCHTPSTVPDLETLHAPHARELARELYRSALTLCWGTLTPYNQFRKVHALLLNSTHSPSADILKNTLSNMYIYPIKTTDDFRKIEFEIIPEDAIIIYAYAKPRASVLELSGTQTSELLSLPELVHAAANCEAHITVVVFDTPYRIADCSKAHTCLLAYEDVQDAQHAAADALLGRLTPEGSVPICL